MPKLVFLDTNVYLHYQPFDQINWPQIVDAEAVTIVIPPVIIRELNKHKDSHPRPSMRKRAGNVLKRLSGLFESGSKAPLRQNVEACLEDRDPLISFAEHQLSREIQDDNLIASMIVCRNETPEAEVVLVTSDAGLALLAKARRHGITTVKTPDNLKVVYQPDPSQKRIRELEEALRELKLKTPQLSLTLEDGNQYGTFVLPRPVDLKPEELERKLRGIKQRYPKREAAEQSSKRKAPGEPHAGENRILELVAAMSPMNTVSPEDITRYNTQLDRFYVAYAQHLKAAVQVENLNRRTVSLVILLANDGTAPAEDIDVFMRFPDGFELTREGDIPRSPKPPDPPAEPRTPMQKFMDSTNRMVEMPYLGPRDLGPVGPPPNVSDPRVRRTDSYEVTVHVQRVKHNLQESFQALYVVFESYETAESFQIDYRILAANVPHEVPGTLHVIIEKAGSGQ